MNFPFLNRKKSGKEFKTKKDSKKDGTWYRVCPNCLSPDLKYVPEFTSGWLTPPRYFCPICNYSGNLFMEIDIDIFKSKTPEELRNLLRNESENPSQNENIQKDW